jgi:cysteine synthase
MPRKTLARELPNYPNLVSFLEGNGDLYHIFDLLPQLDFERKNLYKSLYENIGNTPVHIIDLANGNKLYLKMECENDMGENHYSRYWLIHLAIAEALNIINPETSKIIEVTSGSSGISLSLACNKLGYNLTMIIPQSLPYGRVQPMETAGTIVIKVSGYIDACIERLKDILLKEQYYAANHSEDSSNLITYIFSRIASEFNNTHQIPDVTVLALGNGTSTEAIAKVFKLEKRTKIYAYYPSFDSKQIIFGLYGPNVELKHIPSALELVDKMLFTSDYNIEDIKRQYKDDPIVSQLGISSLYGIKFVEILSKQTKNLVYFSVAYDKINRYSLK